MNRICVCGHPRVNHLLIYHADGISFCNDCCIKSVKGVKNYHYFKLDNLSYLEQQYEKSIH